MNGDRVVEGTAASENDGELTKFLKEANVDFMNLLEVVGRLHHELKPGEEKNVKCPRCGSEKMGAGIESITNKLFVSCPDCGLGFME